ncbi:MAG: peptidoglycan editing factor PgeF [Candidatus Poribacteria bacterium]|nr:peptidoglycan editing factor PgeF [Candidatus Poribacteria bacterium]
MKLYHPVHEFQASGVVTAGISLRHGGVSRAPYTSLNLAEHVGDDESAVASNRDMLFQHTNLKNLHYCRQIHSTSVIDVDNGTGTVPEVPPEADALVSAHCGTALGIFTADCVPIFILDFDTPAIGIAHAGWRGTFDRIAVNTLAQMKVSFGTVPASCQIHLGPSIQKCCYTVSTELLDQFAERFGSAVHDGKNLSLQDANLNQLVEAGLPPVSISVSPLCTACRTDLFYSHRAENGQTGRMLSFIQLHTEN